MNKVVLYINGLGDGTTQAYEAAAFKKMEACGFKPIHAHVRWREEQDFEKVLERLTKQAQDLIKKNGSLVIVGLSAGGSMALNIYNNLKDQDIRVINIIGRLHRGRVPSWSYRTLERSSHFNTPHESKSFYHSVIYCEDTVIPFLTSKDKKRVVMLKPYADLVVPLHTMNIQGVRNIRIPAFGHSMACAVGLRKVADIL
jgi:hypothetical protein